MGTLAWAFLAEVVLHGDSSLEWSMGVTYVRVFFPRMMCIGISSLKSASVSFSLAHGSPQEGLVCSPSIILVCMGNHSCSTTCVDSR